MDIIRWNFSSWIKWKLKITNFSKLKFIYEDVVFYRIKFTFLKTIKVILSPVPDISLYQDNTVFYVRYC